ncbi:MAG: GNAT family N-acetyltransferase [bacterium]
MRATDSCVGPAIRIRKGRAVDADMLVTLYAREPAVSDFDGLHTPERFRSLARSRSAILLVAECGGRVIAALDAEVYAESKFSYFANIVVVRRHRGQGIGAQLMARYEQCCRRRGITTILALVYDWNRDMHQVMRRKRYRNSGRLVEYIKKL